ncbi:MAG: glucose/sorbosone dehydrogenase, partial [Pedosphaera sp.]|nr:glucose/sorbosone dehydrogenase [Pedosphaera sp.]
LRKDGTIVAWGFHVPGDYEPPAGLSNVVSMGNWRALKSDGTVVVWGPNSGVIPDINAPPAGLSNVVAVATGPGRHYAVVRVDDAHPPSAAAGNVVATEGAGIKQATVTVTLSAPMAKTASLSYATADDTAKAGWDYIGAQGRIIFPPNVTTQIFNVPILAGLLQEPTKKFFVNFSAPSNAALFTTQMVVSIVNKNTLILPPGFGASVLATNLTLPTAMEFAPDGRIFVCEQRGQVQIIKGGTKLPSPFLSLPVTTEDDAEAGLLGIAFDPNFASNNYVYVYYTVPGSYFPPQTLPHNRISRFTAQGDSAPTNTEFILLELDPLTTAQQHNGGALHFGPDGKLYAGVGDDGNGTNSQSLTNLLGKILRINPDGSIPSDNPFFLATTDKNRAIWALGLRNPFSFAFHPQTGRLLINDVGLSTWEEINEGHAGSNYGWPNVEGPAANAAYQDPIFAYGHSGTNGGCAIVGGVFYAPTQSNFPSAYAGNYFFADYCNGWIRRLTNGDSPADFVTGLPGIVGLQVGPDGALYALAHGFSSSLYRISWKDRMQIANVVKATSGPVQLNATARTNHTYILDASTNLVNWTSIQTNLAASDKVTFSDATATNFDRRFYRVRE